MKNSLLFLSICIFLFACKAEPERILIKLNKGQKYKQRVVSKTTNTQNAQGKNRSTTAISESVYNYEVVDVQDTGLVTETKMKQDMVGNMKILKAPASMADTSIMMQVKGEITITNTLM